MDNTGIDTRMYKIVLTTFVVMVVWKIIQILSGRNHVNVKEEGFKSIQQFSPELVQKNGKLEVAKPEIKSVAPQPCDLPQNFYLKKNRYLMDGKSHLNKTYYTVNENQTGENRGEFDWRVPHESGPNDTYGDLLWHYVEPRMILQDNCMRCNEFGPTSNHNVPNGVGSSFTAEFDGNLEDGLDKLNGTLLYDNLGMPDFTTGGQGTVSGILSSQSDPTHVMSPPRNNGIVPYEQGCVKTKVLDPNRCGCDGFGKEFNFH